MWKKFWLRIIEGTIKSPRNIDRVLHHMPTTSSDNRFVIHIIIMPYILYSCWHYPVWYNATQHDQIKQLNILQIIDFAWMWRLPGLTCEGIEGCDIRVITVRHHINTKTLSYFTKTICSTVSLYCLLSQVYIRQTHRFTFSKRSLIPISQLSWVT
jgi:hypothetical protein